jgi:hypothetical protein
MLLLLCYMIFLCYIMLLFGDLILLLHSIMAPYVWKEKTEKKKLVLTLSKVLFTREFCIICISNLCISCYFASIFIFCKKKLYWHPQESWSTGILNVWIYVSRNKQLLTDEALKFRDSSGLAMCFYICQWLTCGASINSKLSPWNQHNVEQ